MTLRLICFNWCVTACISRRPHLELSTKRGQGVAWRRLLARSGGGMRGVIVYITHYGGRGASDPTSTRIVWSGGRVSKFTTASVAAASARPLTRILVCALLFRVGVAMLRSCRASWRPVMLCSRSMWWWWWWWLRGNIASPGLSYRRRMAFKMGRESVKMPNQGRPRIWSVPGV